MIIKPAEVIVSEAFDEIEKTRKEKGISLEDLPKRGREIRGDIVDDEYGTTQPRSRKRK